MKKTIEKYPNYSISDCGGTAMREILFRGKKKESGVWVAGDLIQLHEEAPYWFILPEGISSELYEDEPYTFRDNDVMCRVALAKVIPETIGQFTGLTDKNGKRIFEGDIVVTRYPSGGICSIGDVQFDCGVFGAEWTVHKKNKTMVGGWGNRHNLRTFEDEIIENIEVVGNIHDNPELLEVE